MKTRILSYSIAFAALIFAFTSCTKSSTSSSGGSGSGTDAQTQADDQTFYTNETNYATDDANAALNASGGSYNSRPAGIQSPITVIPMPCDTSSVVIDTIGGSRTITINYNGSTCESLFNHKRSGNIVITFSPGFKWGTKNDTLTITFNLTSVRLSDNKTITITGTRTIINTTGGLIKDLVSTTTPVDSVGYSLNDNTSILFANGTTRSWQASFHRTYTFNSTDLGEITTVGSLSGTNRYGDNFSANITEPLVVQGCSNFRFISGQVSYTGGEGGTSTITFGLDSSGTAVTGCQGASTLYYNFDWNGPNGGKYTYNGTY